MQIAQCLSSLHLWPELEFSSYTVTLQDELTYMQLAEKLCLLSHNFWGDPTFWTHSSLTQHLFSQDRSWEENGCARSYGWSHGLTITKKKKTTNNVPTLLTVLSLTPQAGENSLGEILFFKVYHKDDSTLKQIKLLELLSESLLKKWNMLKLNYY